MAAIDLVVLGMIKNQHTIHLQKGNSIGGKGVYQKQFRKRRKNAGEGGLFIDRRRGRKI